MPTRSRLHLLPLEDRSTPATLTDGFELSIVTGGLTKPTSMVEAPDGRLFVAEQEGTLRVVDKAGTLAPSPALALTVTSKGESGLIGITLDPDFATNGYLYAYYTVPAVDGAAQHNRVSRFTVAGNAVDPATERVLIDLNPLPINNHMGGGLTFGLDGKLYVAVGDNGTGTQAQELTNYFGKILRLNPDGSIPADNPTAFAGLSGTPDGPYRAIFAVGLRNPFTLGTDPVTGNIYVNDVGDARFEEVDVLAAGANYGWPTTEGRFPADDHPAFTEPVISIPHAAGTAGGYSVLGAAFYHPATTTFPAEYVGDYFYADFINKWVFSYDPATGVSKPFASDLAGFAITDLDVSRDGSLLILNRGLGANPTAGNGQVVRIQAVAPPPVVVPPPPEVPPPATTPPLLPPPTVTPPPTAQVAAGLSPMLVTGSGGAPVVRVVDPATGAVVHNFDLGMLGLTPAFTGGVRVASGDVTGDGVLDVIVGAAPGGLPRVVVLDGTSGDVVSEVLAFEATFTGGVFVAAADVDGDGRADVIVTPDDGGGPRVRVYRSGDPTAVLADFFGIEDANFRGGARVAAGDVSGDGRADVIVTAGLRGASRVAGFDGRSLAVGQPAKVFADFFAFESSLRNGVYVAVGDLNGDGRDDLVFGGGPGGGPRVLALSGLDLARGVRSPLADFFAGDIAARDGVRVGTANTDDDGRADIVVGTADASGRVLVYAGGELPVAGPPPTAKLYIPFAESLADGVYVG